MKYFHQVQCVGNCFDESETKPSFVYRSVSTRGESYCWGFLGAIGALVSVGAVQGQRYYSPRASSEEAWFAGYSIFIFRPPIFRITGGENVKWQQCQKLEKGIAGIFSNYEKLSSVVDGPFEYIVEVGEHGYDAYIKSGSDVLVFFSRYPDKSGDLPEKEEHKICNTQL